MAYSVTPTGAAGDFPKVPTGEYPFAIDELHIVRFEGDDYDKVRVFFNLGVCKTTKGDEEEVRLTKTYKPSPFSGSADYPASGWFLLCRAVGLDPKAALADLEVMIGKAGVAPVVREQVDGKDKNSIGAPMPLGAASAPEFGEPKGIKDKRAAYVNEAAGAPVGDPNW